MDKSECFGCKTHFQQNAKLPLEGISVQLKNYPIPIKDQSHKFKLLKTICSFLNSKGGTIFIGAQDKLGEIKEQDDFRIFIQQLTDRIQPKVDLSDREEILVQFVPVFNMGKFIGKHVIKILIKQGDPAELYCFTKKIQLESIKDKKVQEYEIVCSYKRLNSGNIQELKGYQLVKEAKAKAAKPCIQFNCFHGDCNPQPLNISLQILKIGFSKLPKKEIRQILQQWIEAEMTKLEISTDLISCDHQNEMIVVEFNNKNQFNKADDYVTKNIKELNLSLEGYCCFQKRDKFLDCILYENVMKSNSNPQPQKQEQGHKQEKKKKFVRKQKVEDPEKKQKRPQKSAKIEQVSQKISSQDKLKGIQNDQKNFKSDSQQRTNKKIQEVAKRQQASMKKEQNSGQKKENYKNIGKKFSLTFTHINPKKKEELRAFLDSLVDCKKNFEVYENTVEVFFPNEDFEMNFFCELSQQNNKLLSYGFKNEIFFGINTGIIDILNFEKSNGKQLIGYLKNLIGKQLKGINPVRKGGRHVMRLLLSPPSACQWLDKLLNDKNLKAFKIPGAEKGQKPKMKIHLQCANLQDAVEDYMFML